MIAIVTLLLAVPLGLWCRSRLAAHTAYAVVYLWSFVYQSVYLVLGSLDPGAAAPPFELEEFPLSYGLVSLAIFGVGFVLVEGGHRWRTGRGATRAAPVSA